MCELVDATGTRGLTTQMTRAETRFDLELPGVAGARSMQVGIIDCGERMAFEPGDIRFERLLELDDAGIILVDSFGLFDAFDVGAKSFGKEDGGEYLNHAYSWSHEILAPRVLTW